MANGWIAKVQETEKKRGTEAAIERGRAIYCSLSLGREFSETVEQFAARNPELSEFFQWFDNYQGGGCAANEPKK